MNTFKSTITVRSATYADAFAIDLCEQDVRERVALGQTDEVWRGDVASHIENHGSGESIAFTDHEGNLVALGGAYERGGVIVPWMLFDKRASLHKRALTRCIILARDCLLALGMMMTNVVHKDSIEAINLLKRLGARVKPLVGHPDLFVFQFRPSRHV